MGAGVTSKRVGGKKKARELQKEEQARLAAMEVVVAEELVKEIDIQGGHSKPQLSNLLVVHIARLPYTLPKAVAINLSWFVRHSVRGEPYSEAEKIQLLTSALGRSEEAIDDEYTPEEKKRLIDMECWDRKNFQAFEEDQFRRKYPERYKQYKRWKNKQPN